MLHKLNPDCPFWVNVTAQPLSNRENLRGRDKRRDPLIPSRLLYFPRFVSSHLRYCYSPSELPYAPLSFRHGRAAMRNTDRSGFPGRLTAEFSGFGRG